MIRISFGWTACVLWIALNGGLWAATEPVQGSTAPQESSETEPYTSPQASEAVEVVPLNIDLYSSTQPVTPISEFGQKPPYDTALDEFKHAHDFWETGKAEAASDMALVAYDDLTSLRHVRGVKRSRIRSQIHQVATLYIKASIAYIKQYMQAQGSSADIKTEVRLRFDDLRDIARDYPELNADLNKAIASINR